MRVTFAFLVAIAFSTSWVVTNAEQPSISAKTSTFAVESTRAAPGDPNAKRFLRSHRVSDGEDEEDSDDDEERFKQWKIDDLAAGKTSTLFAKWKAAGRSEDYIYTKLKARLSPSDFNDVMRWYRAYIK
ncbi:RxLR effector protein [Phytophthora megakarya]|uniref:RxLR effector protein n=1 Tax=Phytophthora megakarya TaxID=4795 RepID=A0A225UXD7_9STRA|nr:RxLR effector protein [Phytophthora megakarya]